MHTCPICQRPADLIPNPDIHRDALYLAHKFSPDWQPADGACRACIENIINTAAELEELREREHMSAGFNEHYRYTLNDSEHTEWWHANSDMASWRQKHIAGRARDAALEAGREYWIVLDTDETLLAHGDCK